MYMWKRVLRTFNTFQCLIIWSGQIWGVIGSQSWLMLGTFALPHRRTWFDPSTRGFRCSSHTRHARFHPVPLRSLWFRHVNIELRNIFPLFRRKHANKWTHNITTRHSHIYTHYSRSENRAQTTWSYVQVSVFLAICKYSIFISV